MHPTVTNERRHRSLFRSEFFQVCIGLALAILLFQADRAISGDGDTAPLPHAIVNKDAIAVGFHIVRLECDTIVAALDRVVRIAASPCHFISISK
jgi:hypothetical protein